jgi:hypothetical protein
MDLRDEFRTLVFKYGITNVMEYAELFVKESYDEINKIHVRLFLKQTVEEKKVVQNQAPVNKIIEKLCEPRNVAVNDMKEAPEVKTNKEAVETVEVEPEGMPSVELPKKPKKCIKKVKKEDDNEMPTESPVENTIENVDETPSEPASTESPEEAEKKRKEEEKKRKKEEKREQNKIAKRKLTDTQKATFEKNKANGINPYDMLTKKNLEKWLIDEERTYADVAKNIVGCTDKEVSLAAKQFDIKSKYMGADGMIKAGRKKKTIKT